jgi:hypothetical protein
MCTHTKKETVPNAWHPKQEISDGSLPAEDICTSESLLLWNGILCIKYTPQCSKYALKMFEI